MKIYATKYSDDRAHAFTTTYEASWSESGYVRLNNNGAISVAGTEYAFDDATPAGDGDSLCVPISIGAIGILYHLKKDIVPDNEHLKLDLDLVASIYNGTVTRWNDPRIVALNKHLLPNLSSHSRKIDIAYRAASSGTTLLFTRALSASNQWWRDNVGEILQFQELQAKSKPVRNDPHMADTIETTESSVGYASMGAFLNLKKENENTPVRPAWITNSEGKHIGPDFFSLNATIQAFSEKFPLKEEDEFQQSELPPYEKITLHNVVGPDVYPLCIFSFLCLKRKQNDTTVAKAILRFFKDTYRFQNEAQIGQDLAFAAIPEPLASLSMQHISDHVRCGDNVCTELVRVELIVAITAFLILLFFMVVGLIVICLGIVTYRKMVKAKADSRGVSVMTQKLLDQNDSDVLLEDSSSQFMLQVGEDDLVLEDQIGAGSFAEVYRGKWLGITVAVKRFLRTDAIVRDFSNEASIMSRLRHPNIVQYLGASIQHPHLYILTEYCELGNLQSIIRDEKIKLSLPKTVALAIDAARGMLYLHSASPPVLHRDFKSANILVDSNWTAKVADFGMSRVLDTTTSMTVCGTAETCAPEVLSRSKYTEKADVYSFGIVLWEMMTRERLYPGLNFYTLTHRVVTEALRPPLDQHTFPPEIRDLMTRCWHEDANARPNFQTILQVLQDFADSFSRH